MANNSTWPLPLREIQIAAVIRDQMDANGKVSISVIDAMADELSMTDRFTLKSELARRGLLSAD